MSRLAWVCPLYLALTLAIGMTARADSYSADRAYAANDFPRAFALYEEIAQLGHLRAQENLAGMYVSGEGVARDNVAGYAWALIAQGNGSTDAVQPIIDQLGPRVTPAARVKIDALRAQFGKAALEKSLLPTPLAVGAKPWPVSNPDCTFKTPANPDIYYPRDAIAWGYSGNVYVEFDVAPDGRARNPRVRYSWPPKTFDEPARRVIFASTFKSKVVDGVAAPCTLFIAVKFTSRANGSVAGDAQMRKSVAETRLKAEAGDPQSQFQLGLALLARPDLRANDELGQTYLLKAAQSGISSAQYLVGRALIGGGIIAERDEVKGRRWIDLAARQGQADAQVEQAYRLLTLGDAPSTAKAMDLLELAAKVDQREAKLYLAALLASGSLVERRDGNRALSLVDAVLPDAQTDPTTFEIRAAANALLGRFDEARKDQSKALKMAKSLGRDPALPQARLANYIENRPFTGDLFAF